MRVVYHHVVLCMLYAASGEVLNPKLIKTGIGCGMGLTVAHHSVRSLGGEINVANNPEGQGTVSTFFHPIHAAHEPFV